MNAMEKVAWAELTISLGSIVVVSSLYPFLGSGATGGFGLLGLLGGTIWFLRRRNKAVLVDERDRQIEQRATLFGIESAWMVLFVSLIVIVIWSSQHDVRTVNTSLLTWLVWIQFAICYAVKGLAAVVIYRRQKRAA